VAHLDAKRVNASPEEYVRRVGAKAREAIWQSTFHVSHHQAGSYGREGAYLARDAAHVHSPLGTRGMNTGIEDAAELARRIVSGRTETYASCRHRTVAKVARFVRRQTRAMTRTDRFSRFLVTHIIPLLLRNNALRRWIARRMTGLDD